jgi:hypothetical protein
MILHQPRYARRPMAPLPLPCEQLTGLVYKPSRLLILRPERRERFGRRRPIAPAGATNPLPVEDYEPVSTGNVDRFSRKALTSRRVRA